MEVVDLILITSIMDAASCKCKCFVLQITEITKKLLTISFKINK